MFGDFATQKYEISYKCHVSQLQEYVAAQQRRWEPTNAHGSQLTKAPGCQPWPLGAN